MSTLRWFVVTGVDRFVLLPVSAGAAIIEGTRAYSFGPWTVRGRVARAAGTDTVMPVVSVDMAGVSWTFGESPSVWRPLAADDQARLELQRTAADHPVLGGSTGVMLTAAANGQKYWCDVQDMHQLNVGTGGKRKLARSHTPAAPTHVHRRPSPSTVLAPAPTFAIVPAHHHHHRESTPRDVSVGSRRARSVSPQAAHNSGSGHAAAAAPLAPAAAMGGAGSAMGVALILSDDSLPADVVPVGSGTMAPSDADNAPLPPAPVARPGPRSEQSRGRSVGASAPPPRGALMMYPSSATPPGDGRRRLLFPSVSTSVFMFDVKRAARIATGVIADFLAAHPGVPDLSLTLVDYDPHGRTTETVQAFAQEWTRRGNPDARFSFVIGDVSSPATRGRCFAVVNASNSVFRGGASTSGFNRAVYVAAGPHALETDTKARHGTKAAVSVAYDVPLRMDSPLRLTSGAEHVIHVVGPNMNPQRNDCLHGDYATGDAQLAAAYRNFLDRFKHLAGF
jgi:O-acetyl-ADP-ribose deacetylase (regulator of RNase III)